MRINKEDVIAMVIDFQEKLVPHMNENSQLIKNTIMLIQGLEILQVPIITTQQYTKGLGMTVDEIYKAFSKEFKYQEKISFSCYGENVIKEEIRKLGKKSIIICGIEAHICVLQTVIDLLDDGYDVIIIEDCISSRKNNDKLNALRRMEKEGAIIATYESILFELTKVAGNDTFKAISKLIK
jgi:nicotinamidase-related amidase